MLIGITGGIGSGKSTIANALKALGYPVYNTDAEAKRIITENIAVRSQIEYLFGSEVYDHDVYQTNLVAQQVFRDPSLLEQLNRIVHPAVAFDVRHWSMRMVEDGAPDGFCFVESAILFESGLNSLCDFIVEITAPLETRITRTIHRDNVPREQVEKRIAAQMSEDERIRLSNLTILNDGIVPVPDLAESMLQNIKNALAQSGKKQ